LIVEDLFAPRITIPRKAKFPSEDAVAASSADSQSAFRLLVACVFSLPFRENRKRKRERQ
jgi:hypothetical protein